MELKVTLCTEELEEMIARMLKRELPLAFGNFFHQNIEAENLSSELGKNTAAYIPKGSNNDTSLKEIDIDVYNSTEESSRHIFTVIDDELQKVYKECEFYPNEFPQIIEQLKRHVERKALSLPKNPFFVAKGNVKKLGSSLGNIYRRLSSKPLSYEYLCLCRSLFICYSETEIDKNDFQNSNLYKYLKNKK